MDKDKIEGLYEICHLFEPKVKPTVKPTEFEIALSRLNNVKKSGGRLMAQCPCHHDLHQSLSISDSHGKALLYCHAGCKYEDIIAKLELRLNHESIAPILTHTYDYTDSQGNLIYRVLRYQPKNFKQCRPDPNHKDCVIWDLKGISPLLYHLPEVINAGKEGNLIWSVEGEKDVETLRLHNQVATTISGGSSSQWTPQMISILRHTKVAIIPDNDKPGKDYAKRVADQLYGWCDSLRMITLPVPVKGDVTDYLESGKTIENLLNIYDNTPEYTPIGAVTRDEYASLKGQVIYLHGLFRFLQSSKKKQLKDIL